MYKKNKGKYGRKYARVEIKISLNNLILIILSLLDRFNFEGLLVKFIRPWAFIPPFPPFFPLFPPRPFPGTKSIVKRN